AQAAELVRLYDGVTAFIVNPDGKDFAVSVDIRDINHRMHGPSELLIKAYDPDGRVVVREVVEDDGVLSPTAGSTWSGGWDHEAWYYHTTYSRGLNPLTRWSAFSDPARVANMPKRTKTYEIKGAGKGVYRLLLVGSPDHYVSIHVDPELKYGLS